jgi:hypothetical protein
MRDIEIRNVLHEVLREEFSKESDAVIVEELGLSQGNVRIDLAVIDGFIHGYEIKSDRDTLKRLPTQSEIYSKSLDYVTIVTTARHLRKVRQIIPRWWGICEARYRDSVLLVCTVRRAKGNPSVNPSSLVQLLWREEALEALKELQLHQGIVNKPRRVLWKLLAENLSLHDLRALVSKRLKSRKNWLSAHSRGRGGG